MMMSSSSSHSQQAPHPSNSSPKQCSSSSSFSLKQTLLLVITTIVMMGYFVQFSIVRDLHDMHHTYEQSSRGSNNNNNIIMMLPMVQGAAANGSGNANNNGAQQQQQLRGMYAPRSRIQQSKVMEDLQKAMTSVEALIQPALGPESSNDDPSLKPYSTDLRGVDFEKQPDVRDNRIVYLITPTYTRQTQVVDLTRVGQTLRLAREAGYHHRLYWIIIEDADHCSHRVRQLALESGVPFAHKAVKTPKLIKQNPRAHRGLEQRNAALDIIENDVGKEGVAYFMDDDNAYNVQLFHELSYTTHVSVFGTGLPGGSAYERCHVDPKTGKVDELLTTWHAPRTFSIDMAGFAFATHHLAKSRAKEKPMRFSHKSKSGYLENDLMLFAANSVGELEPLAANCTRILAWHVKTKGNDLYYNPEPNKDVAAFNLMKGLV